MIDKAAMAQRFFHQLVIGWCLTDRLVTNYVTFHHQLTLFRLTGNQLTNGALSMQVVSCVQQKGGAGKSTLVCALASSLGRDGAKVVIVDTDRQQSCVAWAEQMDLPNVDTLPLLNEEDLAPALKGLTSRYDVALIDTAGYDSQMASYVIQRSSLIFIPTGGARASIVGAGRTYRHIQALTEMSKEPPVVRWVIWNVRSNTAVFQQAKEMIRQSDMPVVAANVPSLTGFEKMTWTGGHPEGTAAMAMREFVAELQMTELLEFYTQRKVA